MRHIGIIRAAAIIFALICVFSVSAFASGGDITSGEVPDELSEYFPDGEGSEDLQSFVKSFDTGYFFSFALKAIKASAPKVAGAFSTLLGLLIIASVLGVIRDSTVRAELKSILSYICAVCVCGAAYSITGELFSEMTSFVSRIGEFLRYVIPVMGTLLVSGGSVTFSAVCCGLLYAAASVTESLCEGFLLPVLRICLCVSMGAAMLGSDALAGITAPLKKLISFVLAFVMMIFSTVLAFQGIIAKSADSALLKSVKFAASGLIPIVGGAIGDAMSSLSGGVSVIKSSLGGAGAAAIIIIMITPLCMLALYKVMLELSSSAAGLLGLTREGKFLAEVSSLSGFLMAVMSCIAVFFIIALAAFSSVGSG